MSMTLAPARTRNPGAVVVGMTPDQRNDLRDGLVWLAAGLLATGLGLGYVVGKNKGRQANPTRPALARGASGILNMFARR